MHEDPREKRRLAADWREYLRDSVQCFRVYVWAWREFVTPEARKWGRRGLLFLLASTVFVMLEPLALKWIVDGLEDGMLRPALYGTFAFFIFKKANHWLAVLFNLAREQCVGRIEARLDTRTTELFLGKSLGQHLSETDELVASNVEKGRNRIMQMVLTMLFWCMSTLLEVFVAYVFLWLLFPEIGAVMTLLVVQHVLWSLYLNRRVVVECTPIDAEIRRVNRYKVERWDNVERVKTNGKELEEVSVLDADTEAVWAWDRRFWLWFHRKVGWRGAISVMFSGGCVGYAVWRIWLGDWPIGSIMPLAMWVQHVTAKLWALSHLELEMNMHLPSVMSLRRALTIRPAVRDVDGAVRLPADRPVRVRFENVSHSYRNGSNGSGTVMRVLQDVSLTVRPGEKVALLGDSGAGKTTLIRLVQRYMDPACGRITVDGHDLRNIRLESWARLVGYIPQQAQVLDGTIRYNLLYGLTGAERATISDEELWRVMRLLKIDFGERLADGLDTVVGRRGIRLSGGQAQRLMIGAAVLKRPRFMVIDEATSSLDSTTERAVQAGLTELLGPEVSALIVTHRLPTVRHLCTRFVVLRSVADIAEGESQVEYVGTSFEDLNRHSSTFRRLAADQDIVFSAAEPQTARIQH